MACFHPLFCYRHKFLKTKNGKNLIVFDDKSSDLDWEQIQLPCGQCIGCRLDKAKDWRIRCYFESLYSSETWFITLTYDNDHLLVNKYGKSILEKQHLQKFLKDLRRYYKYHYNVDNIRFFSCGEYGEQTQRPHYHMILYNLAIPDLVFYKRTSTGLLFNSEILSGIWSRGHVVIADFSWNTAAYIRRYTTKCLTGLGADPERPQSFLNMSRRPGIGSAYFSDHFDEIYRFDNVSYLKGDKVKVDKPPAYFDKLLDAIDSSQLEIIKSNRLDAAIASRTTHYTDKSFWSYNQTLERNALSRISAFSRDIQDID